MSTFERYLTLWVALCIVVGIALGHWFPIPFQVIGRAEAARVNLPVAVLIWLMIIPMLLKIDIGALHQVKEHWRGIGVTSPRRARFDLASSSRRKSGSGG